MLPQHLEQRLAQEALNKYHAFVEAEWQGGGRATHKDVLEKNASCWIARKTITIVLHLREVYSVKLRKGKNLTKMGPGDQQGKLSRPQYRIICISNR